MTNKIHAMLDNTQLKFKFDISGRISIVIYRIYNSIFSNCDARTIVIGIALSHKNMSQNKRDIAINLLTFSTFFLYISTQMVDDSC